MMMDLQAANLDQNQRKTDNVEDEFSNTTTMAKYDDAEAMVWLEANTDLAMPVMRKMREPINDVLVLVTQIPKATKFHQDMRIKAVAK